jgi:NAD(P)-dependent dehydrogenase (short-subunit alcohol dehydrogenase family)
MPPTHILRASSLAGKHAVVTGGSRGIGLAIARRFAAEGASVTLLGRHQETLEAARDGLSALSRDDVEPRPTHAAAVVDVGSQRQWEAWFAKDKQVSFAVAVQVT